jgi:hypothetical protein
MHIYRSSFASQQDIERMCGARVWRPEGSEVVSSLKKNWVIECTSHYHSLPGLRFRNKNY